VTAVILLLAALAQQTAPPPPQPFPRPGSAAPSRPGGQPTVVPAPPPTAPAPDANANAPAEASLGVPMYPGAQFLGTYDAGRGQQFLLYGSTASFVDIVSYYRTVLKQRGELVFDAPGTHVFEVGRFREETMAFPPGVTVKDFQSEISQGYPNPRIGAQPSRFPTVIQIVPPSPESR
jgi:hypothetical protein